MTEPASRADPEIGDEPVSKVAIASPQPDDPHDGLEFQIALDSLAMGNTEPLKRHLARLEGLDPDHCIIRSGPYNFEKDKMPGSTFRFVGEMDQIGAMESGVTLSPPRPPRVHLLIPERLYKYQALQSDLKQIRLLRLGPEDEQGQVHTLELHAFDLSNAPPFNALSYVWGRPEKIMPLPCNGRRVMITQNLRRAVEKSFSLFPDMWLWADGICINQEDLIERGQQVNMMGEIYGRAALVIAHTGHHGYHVGHDEPGPPSNQGDDTVELSPKVTLETLRLNETASSRHDENSAVKELQFEPTDTMKPGLIVGDRGENRPIEAVFKGTAKQAIMSTEVRPDNDDVSVPDTSQPAISLMNYLSRLWSSDEDYSLKGDTDWEKRKIPGYTEGANEKIWLRLFEFWNDDWFYRSWVLQEAVLGKKVILLVDDAACSLDFVMKFWGLAKKRDTPEFLKRGPLADEYARVLHLNPVLAMKALRDRKHPETLSYQDARKPLAKSDLISLLSLSRTNLASDPRDKVYSVLGLAGGDSIASSLGPDYSETNTAAALYKQVATKCIQSGLGPELLQHAGVDQKIPNLPSWAPDWTYQSRSNIDARLYSCSGNSVASLYISEAEPDKLRARGVIIDTIRMNAMAWRYYSTDGGENKFAPFKEAPNAVIPDFTDEDGRCVVRTFAKGYAEEYCSKFDPSEGLEAALARTLVMDCTWRQERTKSDPSFLESFNAFERLYGAGREDDTPDTVKIHESGIFHWVWDFSEEEESNLRRLSWPFEVALQEAHKGRRFCATAEGYMCTAPYDTERGDAVVILEGFKMPFVLRKSGENWKLVGDCYVHGIMDGELVVPLKGIEAEPDIVSIDANGEQFAIQIASGFTKFQEFCII